MATPEQITELRELVNDNASPYVFGAPQLSAAIDAALGDVRKAAGQVWSIRASRYAMLVDTTEGSSSRKLGNLYKQALEMATFYGGAEASSSTPTARSGTRAIVRP